MAISFQCPQCGKKLKAPDNAAGKSSSCPGCGSKVTCPEPVYDAEVVEMEIAPEKPKGLDPFADLDDDKPYEVAGTPAACGNPRTIAGALPDVRRDDRRHGRQVPLSAARSSTRLSRKPKSKKKKKKARVRRMKNSTGSEIALAILCSGIGCIAGIIWMIQGKPKGLKMFGISFGMVIVWNIINVGYPRLRLIESKTEWDVRSRRLIADARHRFLYLRCPNQGARSSATGCRPSLPALQGRDCAGRRGPHRHRQAWPIPRRRVESARSASRPSARVKRCSSAPVATRCIIANAGMKSAAVQLTAARMHRQRKRRPRSRHRGPPGVKPRSAPPAARRSSRLRCAAVTAAPTSRPSIRSRSRTFESRSSGRTAPDDQNAGDLRSSC